MDSLRGEGCCSASVVSCPETSLLWGLPVGPEPPSISRREGQAMGNDSAAPRLDLAFQG